MTEAIKASWLTGRSDLWRQQTHKGLFPSGDVFGNKGEQKQLVKEEIKQAADNAWLFLFLMSVGGRQKTCVAMFLVLGFTEIISVLFVLSQTLKSEFWFDAALEMHVCI